MTIKSFLNKDILIFFETGKLPLKCGCVGIKNIVLRKLDMLNYAFLLKDLKSPPGNRLEMLKGNFKGQHSIRINDQWRIVFVWTDDGPESVDIVDYHG